MMPITSTSKAILLATFSLFIIPLVAFLNTPIVSADRALPHGGKADPRQTPLAAGGVLTITYTSSVDGVALRYHEYVPMGYNPATPSPLAVLLPGSGGNINQYDWSPVWTAPADAHQYILVTVEPRVFPGYPGSRGRTGCSSILHNPGRPNGVWFTRHAIH